MKAIRLGRLVRLQKTGESYKSGVGYENGEKFRDRGLEGLVWKCIDS